MPPMPVPASQIEQERRALRLSIALTVVGIVIAFAAAIGGLDWVLLVFTVGFMAGYINERRILSRKIVSLLERVESPLTLGTTAAAATP